MLDHVIRGETLPSTAVGIVWRFADTHLAADPRVGAEPDHVRLWLDRIALRLELTGSTEMTREEALATALHADLPHLAPTQELLDALIDRALLVDAAGTVRFPAHVVQEARAARALLNAREDGLDVLRRFVLVELPANDAGGVPVRTVRPSWINTLELALPEAPPHWWYDIASYDPMLTARAAARAPDAPTRPDAAWTIWRTYAGRRVWMDRGMSTMERDDAGALALLVKSNPSSELRDELLVALHDDDPTLRANALQILTVMDNRKEAVERVRTAIADPHPVVRRIAAMAAYHLRAPELAEVLASQAETDPDTMAAQTLIDFAVDLAANDIAATQFAFFTQPTAVNHAIHALVSRCGHASVLWALHEDEKLSTDRRQQLLSTVLDTALRSSWSPSDVVTLIHMLMAHTNGFDALRNAREVLDSQPVAAVLARLCYPPGEWLSYDIGQSVSIMDDAKLVELLNLLTKPVSEIATAAGIELGAELDADSVGRALDYVRTNLTIRQAPPARSSTSTGPPKSKPQPQIDTSSSEGLAAILQWPPATVRDQTSSEQIATIQCYVEQRLANLVADRELPQYASRTEMPTAVWNTLEWAAYFDLALSADAWLQTAQLAVR